jgi:hypothetical protein
VHISGVFRSQKSEPSDDDDDDDDNDDDSTIYFTAADTVKTKLVH